MIQQLIQKKEIEIERTYQLNKDGTLSLKAISGDGYYREYNELGQVIRVRQGNHIYGDVIEEYTYDPFGDRIKTYNTVKNETKYTPFKEFMMIVNETGTFNYTYVYNDNILVARINPDGSKWFYHADHLGSTSLITNQSGNTIEETFYMPYGGLLDGGEKEIKLYEGKELDETGTYYFNARYYSPSMRMFTQPDSIIPDIYDPQQLNIYAFERGNPLRYTDPSGNLILGDLFLRSISPTYEAVSDFFFDLTSASDVENVVSDVASGEVDAGTVGSVGSVALSATGVGIAGKAVKGGVKIGEKVKHAGLLKPYLGKSTKSIEKGIKSLEKRSLEHLQKIKDSNAKKYVVQKWKKEIKVWKEEIKVLRDHLKGGEI